MKGKLNFHFLSALTLCCVAAVLICSCSKKNNSKINSQSEDAIEIQLNDSENPDFAEKAQTWHLTEQKFCVLFGYDFNTPEEYEPILAALKERYGLAEDGGLIYPLIYGESFKRGTKYYASELSSDLEAVDQDFVGIVVLGAPENTHRALANHQDFWNEKVPFTVVSLFPQDDVLGMESTCDVVIDKAQKVDLSGNVTEEESSINTKEVTAILTDTIDYVLAADSALPKDNALITHVQQMLKNRPMHRYVDPETGLQSINHFVLD